MTDYFVRKNNSSFYIRKSDIHVDYSDYSYNGFGFYVSSAQPTGSLVLSVDAANSSSYPGTGTTWYDLAAPSNNLTLSDTMYNTTYGSAMYLSDDKYIYDNDYNDYLNFGTDSFSILLWTRFVGGSASFRTIFNIGTYENGVLLRHQTNGVDSLYIAGSNYHWNPISNLLTDEWKQITIVKSGTNVKLYANTTELINDTAPASVNPAAGDFATNAGLLIGKSAHAAAEYYSGYISLFKIYKNIALTTTQISDSVTEMNTRYGL